MAIKQKEDKRLIRKARIRKVVSGSPDQPRLAIFRSSRFIYAQIIDDVGMKTLAASSSAEKAFKGKLKSTKDITAAKEVGKLIAERAKEKKISAVVFDRSGYRYHGRVKALADGAREGGLKF
jgi:large subunit ribosomal protein L18